jgi:hypothetical protein
MAALVSHVLHVHSARATCVLRYLPTRNESGLTFVMDYLACDYGLIGFGID